MTRNAIISFVLAIFFPVLAAAHPQVEAKDYAGDKALNSNLPIDYRQTCGGCHDIDTINMGYHFQMGRFAKLAPEVYERYRQQGGADSTLPEKQDDLSTPWFVNNPVYGKGGMYGRTAMNHNQKLAPYSSSDPLAAAFTTPDQQNGPCGACHPGGGFATEDQMGNRLADMKRGEIDKALSQGQYLGDYLRSDLKTGKLQPYVWTKKVGDKIIPNVREIDCLICHGRDYSLAAARKYIGKGMTAWAATAGAKLGKINKDKTISYDKKRLANLGNMIGASSNETCGRCHATAYDIDGDGRMTLADNHAFAATPALKNSPGLKKRGQAIGNIVKKIGGVPQRVFDAGKSVQYYDPQEKTWKNTPYLDAHIEAGITCVDCHEPVYSAGDGGNHLKRPSHDLGKGSAGYNVRSDLSGTARCEKCHETFLDDHNGSFGPAWVTANHMEKIHCTTCHIPRKFVALGQSVMKDRGNLGKPDSFKNIIEVAGFGKVAVPSPPDYVYYPDKNPVSGKYELKIKPANIMSQMYWATADGSPLPDRVQAVVFRKAPDTFNLDKTKPGPQTLCKLAYFKNGKAYKLPNGVAVTTDALLVYASNPPIKVPEKIAQARNIPVSAAIIGRKTGKGIKFDLKQGKDGWVVVKAFNNQIVNPMNGETMLVRADGLEWTIIDQADEITFAAQSLTAAIAKLMGRKERVKYVYHLTAYDGAFIMSHSIAPVNGFENNPQYVLQCGDCHRGDGLFNRSATIGVNIADVPGITEFEMPLAALDGNSGNFTECDLRAATFAYYGNTMIPIMPMDGRVLVKDAWNRIDGNVAKLLREKRFEPKYKLGMTEVVRLHLSSETGMVRIWDADKPARKIHVKSWPSKAIVSQRFVGNTMILSLKNPGRDIIIGVSREE